MKYQKLADLNDDLIAENTMEDIILSPLEGRAGDESTPLSSPFLKPREKQLYRFLILTVRGIFNNTGTLTLLDKHTVATHMKHLVELTVTKFTLRDRPIPEVSMYKSVAMGVTSELRARFEGKVKHILLLSDHIMMHFIADCIQRHASIEMMRIQKRSCTTSCMIVTYTVIALTIVGIALGFSLV